MRILVLTSSYPRYPGDGSAPFVQSISENLAGAGHQVVVVAPYHPAVRRVAGLPVRWFRYAPLSHWHIMGHAEALASDMGFRPGVFFLLPLFVLSEFLAGLREARRLRV